MKSETHLSVQEALQLIQENGLLSAVLKGFEPRESQQKMMQEIIDLYNKKGIGLIEAGTGTGKSIAYLIPALLWAQLRKERTLISTNTITLQEQLIHKDIPLLTKALKMDIKAVLVKGMNNYVCKRKLFDSKEELQIISPEEANEIRNIEEWEMTTKDGSRSSLSFVPSSNAWDRVSAENDTCTRHACPHYKECHFFKARQEANDAHILVANHHLFFADLKYRSESDNYNDTAVLPSYNAVILDEAHNIEDVATEYFSTRISQAGLLRTLSRLGSEKNGKLLLLRQKLLNCFKNPNKAVNSIHTRLMTDLPAKRNDLLTLVGDLFYSFSDFVQHHSSDNAQEEFQSDKKLRLLPRHRTVSAWKDEIIEKSQKFLTALKGYVQSIHSLEADLTALKDEKFEEQSKNLRLDITALANRLAGACENLEAFISDKQITSFVRWIELQTFHSRQNVHLVSTDLDIAPKLSGALFSRFPTIVLCSATLSTNQQFQFVRQRLGITEEHLKQIRVLERIYDSPFNYQVQALLAVPSDLPNPTEPAFNKAAIENIWQAIQASHGNAFVLFTSYSMLRTCFNQLAERMVEHRYHPLKQGDDNRRALIEKFKSKERSVLFGTDSFWEGVDVVGEALRCVIIVKLPFKVPSEPIIQARSEAITEKGGDPFSEYSLPTAIVKFKQGFGRLIRNKQDRGCIVCLDTRLINKGYGKQFLNSLPRCNHLYVESASLKKHMSDFYQKTFYLTKKS